MKNLLAFNNHHTFLTSLAEKLHWPHKETRTHKALRLLHTSIVYIALILIGYLIAQLEQLLK
ncbi:MAG: hypothetical protein GW946_00400 [Candidatus Pacebacteria bacterium]|nr:hypothetical protein [Candidatus Paceibacterota bacterium]PIR60163.1 MAG: hypothetical protein COU67_03185 [Candidatus Pacebacteria bacterium CG10_big_fil_rev_8_21_14_0_10_44_54]